MYIERTDITFVHWKVRNYICTMKGTSSHLYIKKERDYMCTLKGAKLHLYSEMDRIKFVQWKGRDYILHWKRLNFNCTMTYKKYQKMDWLFFKKVVNMILIKFWIILASNGYWIVCKVLVVFTALVQCISLPIAESMYSSEFTCSKQIICSN